MEILIQQPLIHRGTRNMSGSGWNICVSKTFSEYDIPFFQNYFDIVNTVMPQSFFCLSIFMTNASTLFGNPLLDDQIVFVLFETYSYIHVVWR